MVRFNYKRRARRGELDKQSQTRRKKEMSITTGSGFTIITGGAIGTDTLVQQCAEEWGMTVKLCLPPHHHRVSETHPAISSKNLALCQPLVTRASRRLGRHPSKNPFVRDLLARNWFIVERAKVVYAYANFEDDTLTSVEGGTGMTVQLCVDHNRDYPDMWKEVFVFDESRQKWYELEREDMRDADEEEVEFSERLGHLAFRECLCAPILHPTSAVVGSRTLGVLGRRVLKDQFKRTVKERARWGATEGELRDEVEKMRQMFKRMSLKEKEERTNEKETSACPIT